MSASIPTTPSRKAAYVARNRAALLVAAQEVFAQSGPATTIDEVAHHAGVASSTVYKHFSNREELFDVAVTSAMESFENDIFSGITEISDPLERLVLPMRKFLRIQQSHPLYARLAEKNFAEITMRLQNLGNLRANILELAAVGVISSDNLEARLRNLVACITAALGHQLLDPLSTPEEGDAALEVALPMLGVSVREAQRLTRSSLL